MLATFACGGTVESFLTRVEREGEGNCWGNDVCGGSGAVGRVMEDSRVDERNDTDEGPEEGTERRSPRGSAQSLTASLIAPDAPCRKNHSGRATAFANGG